jgi:hypothetical protein
MAVQVETCLARLWFQHLKLTYVKQLTIFAFNITAACSVICMGTVRGTVVQVETCVGRHDSSDTIYAFKFAFNFTLRPYNESEG